jgi:RNA polymerase sigma factor (sigma-70 family)
VFLEAVDLPSTSILSSDVDAAFPVLVAAMAQPVYTLALRVCGRDEAEDIAQEAFVRAYKALLDYSPERRQTLEVRPWVLTIALNVARNRLRSGGREVLLDATAMDATSTANDHAAASPEVAADGDDLRSRLITALRRLPPSSREAVVLRHVVGCPVAEVAEILGRPVGTVKAQVWRGLAALRRDLESDPVNWEER